MKRWSDIRKSALVGSLVILPFALMELINRRRYGEGFPFALFGMMWLLPTGFALLVAPIVRDMRTGINPLRRRFWLLVRLAALIFIVFMWTGLLRDQMPCFLGVPNCD